MLGPAPIRVGPDWRSRELGTGRWLSYDPELRAGFASDAGGAPWALLGLAVETRAEVLDPLDAIACVRGAAVLEMVEGWAGRFVLIGPEHVQMDGNGLLGCFFGRDARGDTWISSSPALLAERLSPDAPLARDPRRLRFEVGISWFPPPRARFDRMQRLLPSQALVHATGCPVPRPLLPENRPVRGFEQTLSLLEQAFVTALQRLPRSGGLFLGLSGGFDSRLMLALARRAGVALTAFTRITGRMSLADRLLPPRLARQVDIPHVFLRGRRPSAARRKLAAAHCAGHVSDGDAEPLLSGSREALSGIAFGGHGFALASGFYRLRELPARVEDAQESARALARIFGESPHSTATTAIREWLDWSLAHPEPALDWRDRFFIEQRQAGWLSSKEQLYDMESLERFPILNSARIQALMLDLAEKERLGSSLQVALLQRIAPELLQLPVNPPDHSFGRMRQLALRAQLDPLFPARRLARKLQRWVGSASTRRARDHSRAGTESGDGRGNESGKA